MTDRNIPVTEDELHAYVDNELPAERRSDVEAWLATHPDDAERVQSWRAMADVLHARYDSVANEPVPKRLELERLVQPPRRWLYGAVAASLLAFVAGGGAGWIAHGAAASPSTFQIFTEDALDAHRLYVVEVRHPVEVPGNERDASAGVADQALRLDRARAELDATGLKLVGGRLLPGPTAPASFLMYESASGERFTVYTAKADDRDDADALHRAGQGRRDVLGRPRRRLCRQRRQRPRAPDPGRAGWSTTRPRKSGG